MQANREGGPSHTAYIAECGVQARPRSWVLKKKKSKTDDTTFYNNVHDEIYF